MPVIKKISKYLYQFLCENYDMELANKYIRKLEKSGKIFPIPGCSTIRNGNYFGRNFDFFYSKLIDFVMFTPKSCNRYASVGVGCSLGECTTDTIDCPMNEEVANFLPYCIWDGINEKGVAFSTNVVPSIDLEKQTTGTNPCKPLLYSPFIGRFILDHAGSAREAIELLKNRNIVTPAFSILRLTHDLHFMIADEKETYVVEFVNNKLVYKRNEVLMTNFYIALPPQPHSTGVERYRILENHYEYAGKDMKSMSEVLEQVHYSQAYDLSTDPFWYSEHLGCGIPDGLDITIFNMCHYAGYIQDHAKKVTFQKRGGFLSPWHTMHTSVYDIRKRYLRVFSQENYQKCYEFTFDPGQYIVRNTD